MTLLLSVAFSLLTAQPQVHEHTLRQPPFGEEISFTPRAELMKKPTYQEIGIEPRIIYLGDKMLGKDEMGVKETDIVVFLSGPTYRGTALSQWRQDVIDFVAPHLPTDTVLVVPEFKNCFSDVPSSMKDPQLEWEHAWLERADVLAINLSLHWKNPDGSEGNIGPTTRFEVGYYFKQPNEKELVVFVPSDPKSDSLVWVYFHADDLGIALHRSYSDFYQAVLNACHTIDRTSL